MFDTIELSEELNISHLIIGLNLKLHMIFQSNKDRTFQLLCPERQQKMLYLKAEASLSERLSVRVK